MSEETIAAVIAARQAAEAQHSNPDGSPRTEAQAAAILLAQIHAVLDARPAPPAQPSLTVDEVKAIVEAALAARQPAPAPAPESVAEVTPPAPEPEPEPAPETEPSPPEPAPEESQP